MTRVSVSVALLVLCTCLKAQVSSQTASTNDAQAVINAQFGPQFVLVQNFPVLTGDFNGDGSEDAVFVATAHGGVQLGTDRFRVLDPSSDYFGVGDPAITSRFASGKPDGPRYLLIIHGNGKEGWRAKEPKDRFVLINVAFDHLSVGHIQKKKKSFDDIGLEETGILNSFLYWNGRKYKWQPGSADL
jgi:hypothetical protein